MPDFDELFASTSERPIIYNGLSLYRIDYISFEDGDEFIIRIEKTNSEWRQGIALDAFGFFEINNQKFQDKIILWEDTAQKETFIILQNDHSKRTHSKRHAKKNTLEIKNVWDFGKGSIESWYWGAGMIVEEIENGRRYRCNDGHPDENFDDIVFTIQKVIETDQ